MMKDFLHSACSACGGTVRPRTITQEFAREGVRVSVAGVFARWCVRSATRSTLSPVARKPWWKRSIVGLPSQSGTNSIRENWLVQSNMRNTNTQRSFRYRQLVHPRV